MKKTVIIIAVIVLLLLAAAYLFGFGLSPRYDVHITDYWVSSDGKALTFNVGVSSPAGYVRKVEWTQSGGKLYLDFYPAFGGVNGDWGAKSLFTVPLYEETNTVSVCRGSDVYLKILRKDVNGNWLDAKDVDLESMYAVHHADEPIFESASYDSNYLGVIGEAGNYAFPETALDDEDNTWGRLADGRGWINLSHVEASKDAPMTAGFAWDSLRTSGNFQHFAGSTSEYAVDIVFTAHDTLTNVKLYSMVMFCAMEIDAELSDIGTLTSEKPLMATLNFPGDMSAYGIGFTCGDQEYFYTVTLSGRNGMVEFQPFNPRNLSLFRP